MTYPQGEGLAPRHMTDDQVTFVTEHLDGHHGPHYRIPRTWMDWDAAYQDMRRENGRILRPPATSPGEYVAMQNVATAYYQRVRYERDEARLRAAPAPWEPARATTSSRSSTRASLRISTSWTCSRRGTSTETAGKRLPTSR